ncbi:hypothetical protein JW930_04915 [Candidatus Woesearchaeota archaeon]|nr:hypothetical protein [Candidatus Woesearchaeota archaeon]
MNKKCLSLVVISILCLSMVYAFTLKTGSMGFKPKANEEAVYSASQAKSADTLYTSARAKINSNGPSKETGIDIVSQPKPKTAEAYEELEDGSLKPADPAKVKVDYIDSDELKKLDIEFPYWKCDNSTFNYTLPCIWNFITEPKNQITIWPPPDIMHPEWMSYFTYSYGDSIFDFKIYQNVTGDYAPPRSLESGINGEEPAVQVTGTTDCNNDGYPNAFVVLNMPNAPELDYELLYSDPTGRIGIKPILDYKMLNVPYLTYTFIMTTSDNPRPDVKIAGLVGCKGVLDPASGVESSKVIYFDVGLNPLWANFSYDYGDFGNFSDTVQYTFLEGAGTNEIGWYVYILPIVHAEMVQKMGQEFYDAQLTVTNSALWYGEPDMNDASDIAIFRDLDIQSGPYAGTFLEYAMVWDDIETQDNYYPNNFYHQWRAQEIDAGLYNSIFSAMVGLEAQGKRVTFYK